MFAFMWIMLCVGLLFLNGILEIGLSFFQLLILPTLIVIMVILDELLRYLKEGKNGKV